MAAVLVVLALGDDDDEGGGPPTTTSSTLGEVSDTGNELLDLLEKGRDLALHVRFEQDPASISADSGSLVVEIWRSEGRVRQDLKLDTANGAVRTEVSAFERPEGNYVCQRSAEAEWVCQKALSTATENDRPASLVDAAAANLAGAEVTVTDDTILDTPVRCFAIDGQAGPSTLCVSEDGVPLRLAVEDQELTATVVEREVDDAAFELPADVPDDDA